MNKSIFMNYTMKHLLSAFLILFLGFSLKGQTLGEAQEGTVSFVTSQNVYVKFQSTKDISAGDTLFIMKDTNKIPALIVKDLSSISCVCTRISKNQFAFKNFLVNKNQLNTGHQVFKFLISRKCA